MNKIGIGVHIGGKGVKCAAINLETCELIPGTEVEANVDKDASSRHIITLWSMQIKKVISRVDEDSIVGIGISTPGPFDYQNGIASYNGLPKYEELAGVNVTEELTKRLGLKHIEIRYVNDAVGFAIGEEWAGNLKGHSKAISIIIDEGFGSAFLQNGIPIISGLAVPKKGIIYNLPYENAMADHFFSSRGLVNSYKDKGQFVNNIQSLLKYALTVAKAKDLFMDFGNHLGIFLSPIIKKFNPEIIVFGGAVGSQINLFVESLKERLTSDGHLVAIERVDQGRDPFIFGAAHLCDDTYWKKIKSIIPNLD